jgi:hypothetical protein
MNLISHRGNTNGPEPDIENRPEVILSLIDKKIAVEIDLRWHNNQFYLGHDEPQYEIDSDFLLKNRNWLWVHCKEKTSFEEALKLRRLNCFWHDTDDYTMTSFGYVWAYPGKKPVGSLCVAVMPERCWTPEETLKKCFFAVCTDEINQYSEILNSK